MNHAIILAAGLGQRMKSKHDKLLLPVNNKPLIYYTLIAFNDHPDIDSIILVVNKSNRSIFEKIIRQYHFPKVKKIIIGGQTRQQSFEKGFKNLPKNLNKDDIIISHNADNPLVTQEEINTTIIQAKENGTCIVGHFLNSTLKEINSTHVIKTHDRDKFFTAETPQAAHYELFKKALKNSIAKKIKATDEATLFEAINQKIIYFPASENNFKITTRADYTKFRAIIGEIPEDFRVGIGQDSHMFENSNKTITAQFTARKLQKSRAVLKSPKNCLTLAGLKIPDYPKLKANSDGDVILHTIFNALSQAIGDMSLGFYADEACEKGIKDSKKYLQIILKKIHQQKFKINNLGLMLECKIPKIDPLTNRLKKSLSEILTLPTARIGITATSGENLTDFGAGLGIQCFAIVSLIKT